VAERSCQKTRARTFFLPPTHPALGSHIRTETERPADEMSRNAQEHTILVIIPQGRETLFSAIVDTALSFSLQRSRHQWVSEWVRECFYFIFTCLQSNSGSTELMTTTRTSHTRWSNHSQSALHSRDCRKCKQITQITLSGACACGGLMVCVQWG